MFLFQCGILRKEIKLNRFRSIQLLPLWNVHEKKSPCINITRHTDHGHLPIRLLIIQDLLIILDLLWPGQSREGLLPAWSFWGGRSPTYLTGVRGRFSTYLTRGSGWGGQDRSPTCLAREESPPPFPCEQTHTSENINFPRTSWVVGNDRSKLPNTAVVLRPMGKRHGSFRERTVVMKGLSISSLSEKAHQACLHCQQDNPLVPSALFPRWMKK